MQPKQDPHDTLLASLRYLEMEAVAPVEAAAEFEPPESAEMLYEIAEDHQRHHRELELLLGETDHRPIEVPAQFRDQVTYRVQEIEASIDENEALDRLLSVERFGAERYEEAISSGLLDDHRTLLDRHLADERRHEQYLRERVRGL